MLALLRRGWGRILLMAVVMWMILMKNIIWMVVLLVDRLVVAVQARLVVLQGATGVQLLMVLFSVSLQLRVESRSGVVVLDVGVARLTCLSGLMRRLDVIKTLVLFSFSKFAVSLKK